LRERLLSTLEVVRVTKKKRIIRNKKQRGEWAESVFTAQAGEHGLPVSKPSGESNSF